MRGEAYALGNLGILTSREGRIGESLDWYARCREASRAIQDRWGIMNATGDQAYLQLRLGRFDAARAHAQEALALARDIDDYEEGRAEWHLALAEIEEAAGDLAAARRHVEHAIQLCGDGRYGPIFSDAALVHGRIHEAEGRRDEARALYEQAVERGEAHDLPQVFLRAAAHRALLTGRGADAVVEAAEARGSELNWYARLELAWLLWRATGARPHLVEARRLLDHLQEHAPAQHRDAMPDRVPLYRQILDASPLELGPTT